MSSLPTPAVRNALQNALQQALGDRFEVLRWIGGGGMADVFLARHRTHGALFAVKVLSGRLSGDPAVVSRFAAEARTAATLGGHPNIGEIFDVGEGAGLHYLIMPYVEGEDLSSYLERHGRLPEAEAVEVARQVAEALIWADERHVVHRDLKPSNIRIDRSGRVIVLDFGIAKAGEVPSALTRAGERPGTPHYMSPEQIKGDPCDARSDLYSLGVILFELLSGTKPFRGDTARAIETAHLRKLPPVLSGLVPTVNQRLEQIVNQLLEKDPAIRYPSARELLSDLRSIGRGMDTVQLQPEIDRARPAAALSQQRSRRNLRWLASVVVFGLTVAGGGIYLATRPSQKEANFKKAPPALPNKFQGKAGPMVLVPAGPFVFGSDDPESPNKTQELTLSGFYVDATECSNDHYAKFLAATGYPPPEPGFSKAEPQMPVTGVTLRDAKSYCEWAGERIPTEQEWEKAARGPSGNIYPWGNQPLPSPGKLVPVDEYPERQSPYQALNMSGNVFEWTVSPFPVTDREIQDMKSLTGAKNVSREWSNIKGGSFLLKDERFFRLYMRRGWPADQASPLIGFRCVKDANQY